MFVPSGLLGGFEPVLQGVCGLQGHQTDGNPVYTAIPESPMRSF